MTPLTDSRAREINRLLFAAMGVAAIALSIGMELLCRS